jgi:hypothetical protein
MRDTPPVTILFDAKGATGISKILDVSDFQHIVLSFATDGGGDAALTAKVVGSIEDTAPDFTAAQSVANMYDFIQMKDLEDGSSIDGDTGFAVATADDYRLFAVNVDNLKWLAVRITARTQGELTVKAFVSTNN